MESYAPPPPLNFNSANRTVLVPLCRRLQLVAVGNATWKVVHLSPVLANLGPQLESIAVHSYGESFGSGFQWRLQGQYSLNGTDFTDFASDVVSGVSTEGNAISAAYSTVTDFGLHLRFRIGCQATAGGTAGLLSAVLACKLRI